MISKDKLNKIQEFKNDDSDLINKIVKYLSYTHSYMNKDNVYESISDFQKYIEPLATNEKIAFFSFAKAENFANIIEYNINKSDFLNLEHSNFDESSYYAGKKYEDKIKTYYEQATKYDELIKDKEKVIFAIDISEVSSFPLWDTEMRRKMSAIISSIGNLEEKDISMPNIHKVIKNVSPVKYCKTDKYDIDILITVIKHISSKKCIEVHFIDSYQTNESIYLVNELKKFIYALSLDKIKRYDYIYDTVCKDMDEMFSVYGFCNFKNNKCVSQRHKNIFNRYPVPKTDGCCFKVVRKCEHNNKDGTCRVKCLPCKLFTCPYLGKISLGIRTSEMILLRAFFNNKQKRIALYKFYNSKEFLLKKIIDEEKL